jgi:hypothetical protein
VSLNGIAIAVPARMQSTAIAVSNVFIFMVVCSGRFRTGVIGGPEDSSWIVLTSPKPPLVGCMALFVGIEIELLITTETGRQSSRKHRRHIRIYVF